MENINIMTPLLEKQACSVAPVRMPVLKVKVTAIPYKMTAPGCLHLSYGSTAYKLLHLKDKFHMTHVMPDIQLAACSECGIENGITVLYGYSHWFFKINSLACLEGGYSMLPVKIIRGADEHGINIIIGKKIPVISAHLIRLEFVGKPVKKRLMNIASGSKPDPFIRPMCIISQLPPVMYTDHTDINHSPVSC
jgi:hypothetical protein